MRSKRRHIYSIPVVGIGLAMAVAGYSVVLPHGHNAMSYSTLPEANELIQPLDSPILELPFPIYDPLTPNGNTGSNVNLQNPLNLENQTQYNSENQQYTLQQNLNGEEIKIPAVMTMEEYMKYQLQQSINENWKELSAEQNGSSSKTNGTIPPLNVSNDKIRRLCPTIEIKPQGSAELIFGLNTSKTANPQIPEKQRKITVFDFNQRIQINMVGNICDKMKLNFNYNTEATFDFDNQIKLAYKGSEDEIIQEVEAGNVSLPLTGSLITGAQSLFGIKIGTKWGRLTNTTIFTQNKGKRSEIEVKGGAQTQTFEQTADNYEANKHYLLAQFFRDHFDNAMVSLPVVNSGINITKIEVWVTNNNNTVENTRNIVAFADLGENTVLQGAPGSLSTSPYPSNSSNGLYNAVSNNPGVRAFVNSTTALNAYVTTPGPFQQGVHYEKLQNARLLTQQEYSVNLALGFISLNAPLNNDEVLAVAYQYTSQGQTFQVGEFSTDGISGQNALILKLLKGTITNPKYTRWDLMMKNIYNLGAYQVSPTNFRLDVWYNNPQSSVDINYLPYSGVDGKPLIQIVDMDRYDQNNNPYADGIFDYVPLQIAGNVSSGGGTINPQNGRVIFTTIEPFGRTLKAKMQAAGLPQSVIDGVVFQPLYDSTKTAAQQIPALNRFKIKGQYQSSVGSEIQLNAINIPQGSVIVTAGGTPLVENADYRVDYNLGRVTILNQSILESQTPIKVSVESNTLFSIQTKTLIGSRFDYRVNRNINVGGTIMNLTERPLTQKIGIGDEPISNTMIGLDGSIKKEVPFLTRLVDKIPLIDTKEKSMLQASAEYARIIPGTARAISGISYIDDFEGSQSAIDLRSFNTWVLSSIPKGQPTLFPEATLNNDLRAGMNRAKLTWHVIDPLFYQDNSLTPGHIKNSPMQSDQTMRQVYEQDVFPNRQLAQGQPTNIAMFDLTYYPEERGPYNFDALPISGYTAGTDPTTLLLNNPSSRWGGIMRPLTTTDFELANVEYIQFWLMDPFNTDALAKFASTGGDLYFDLGNISEDILPDSRKGFENGIPKDGSLSTSNPADVSTTAWGYVPNIQPIVNAFDNGGVDAERLNQDVGFDGLRNDLESNFFAAYSSFLSTTTPANSAAAERKAEYQNDVSGDNYHYYRGDDYDLAQKDILERYKYYNNPEGNSPTTGIAAGQNNDGYPTSASTLPNVEDINQDNNLSETEAYFQYHVSIRPNDMQNVGQNHITNIVTAYNTLKDGTAPAIKWYQFRIPVREPDLVVNGIQDLRSIRFIRVFLKGYDKPIVLRMARLELIRGEWRTYRQSLLEDGEYIQNDPGSTTFDVSAVNIEEHGSRQPINYVLPPGINRQVDVTTANLRNLNEQALSLDVCNLQDGDARACYRNVSFDIRSYKRLKMFVHGEASSLNDGTKDDDVTVFIRLGTDFTDNYYEYELPLKLTGWGASAAEDVWPEANNIDIEFDRLIDMKLDRNKAVENGLVAVNEVYSRDDIFAGRRVSIKGNPNLQGLKTVMVGIRNPAKNGNSPFKPDDGNAKCLEVWINELRLTDFDQHGGWATVGRVTANLADFGNVAMSGSYSTPYWGSIDKKVSERQRETLIQFDVASSFELSKFFPEKWGLRLPMYMSYGENISNPKYDLLNPDVDFNRVIGELSKDEQKLRKQINQNYTRRRSMNFANVRKERTGDAKPHFWDVENWSLTYAYNEIFHRDINVEYNMNKTYRGSLVYTFNKNVKPWEPFVKNKYLSKHKWLALVRDVNFFFGPKVVSFRNDINRSYIENIIRANYGALAFPNYTKQFTWVRAYDMKYDITKNLKFDYTANNNGVIGEPLGRVNKLYRDEYQVFKDSVMTNIRQAGITTMFNHTMNLNYQVPLNKIPILDWMTVTGRYQASYDWQRSPFGQDTLGNVIQNSRNVSINGQMNFTSLYNKVPYLKKIIQKENSNGRSNNRRPVNTKVNNGKGETVSADSTATNKKEKDPNSFTFVEQMFRVLMMVKNASVSFSTTDGLLLPGYADKTQLLGMSPSWSAPGFAFVAGRQNKNIFGGNNTWGDYDDYAFYAADQGWLIENQYLNKQYTSNHATNFQSRVTLEPFAGMKIDLNADKNLSENRSSYFRYIDTLGTYQAQNPLLNGVMSMSVITWKTAFTKDGDNYINAVFERFRNSRTEASAVLAGENPNSSGFSSTEAGYYDGYGSTQQDVVIASFIAAYTGEAPGSKHTNILAMFPMPNWRITYDPMAKARWKFFKNRFRSFTIRHGYRSTLNVSNYITNLLGTVDSDGFLTAQDVAGNFINYRQINTITIAEQFAPLVGVDIKWKMSSRDQRGLITKMEFKRDRNLTLSLTNDQLTEIRSREYVFGTGYTFPNLELPFKIGGKAVKSDLDCRADVSIRDNITVTRKLVENYNQPTSGQTLVSIKTSITYTVTNNVQLRAFFDKTITNPKVSTSFRTSNANSGISIRLTL